MTDTTEKAPATLDDIFNDEFFLDMISSDESKDVASIILTEERNQELYGGHYDLTGRKSYQKSEGELTAKQEKCVNFSDYQDLIGQAHASIQQKGYSKANKTESTLKTGDILVANGIVGVIVAINDSEHRNSGQTKRAHIVYANGTENHLLLSSVIANSYKENSCFVAINQ